MSIAKRLEELGLEIPVAAKPVAAYVPAVRVGNYVYTSGQLPVVAGKLQYVGKAGSDVSQEDAYAAAKICALNCLAAVNTVANVEDIEQIVKVLGFVASPQGFTAQPAVVNGASELLVKIFDDKGKHARSAVGVAELPLNAPVEVEMIVKLKD
jgi:enamine deaminase RidA (YjgF/YER057c/UK114 family)